MCIKHGKKCVFGVSTQVMRKNYGVKKIPKPTSELDLNPDVESVYVGVPLDLKLKQNDNGQETTLEVSPDMAVASDRCN